MRKLSEYLQVNEKLIVNKYLDVPEVICPESYNELYKILRKLFEEEHDKDPKMNQIIDLNHIDISKVENLEHLFSYINELYVPIKKIDISYWNVSNIADFSGMFEGCKYLENVGDLSKWNIHNATTLNKMFKGCKRLKSVGDISYWKVGRCLEFKEMFRDCEKLEKINFSRWPVDTVKVNKDNIKMFIANTNQDRPEWIREIMRK